MFFDVQESGLLVKEINVNDIPWGILRHAKTYVELELNVSFADTFTVNNDSMTIFFPFANDYCLPEEKADDAYEVGDDLESMYG